MIRVRLVHTTENQRRPGEFRQKWTIIDHDGTEHTVMTDAEWGDFDQRDDKGLRNRRKAYYPGTEEAHTNPTRQRGL